MSTNSRVAIQLKNRKIKSIYVHWDGYLSGVGQDLLDFYNTEEKVNELLELGNLSILGTSIGEKVDFDKFDSRENKQCLAYGRDRGDEESEAKEHLDSENEQEYNYLFKNGVWLFRKWDKKIYKELTKELVEED
jgi:hypothetical protein